jgi:cold shock CspA family protein
MSCKSLGLASIACLVLGVGAHAAEFRGIIRHVDPARKEVTVEGRGKPFRGNTVVFAIDQGTQILVAGRAGGFADLIVGKHVRVTFEQNQGPPIARTIKVIGLPPLDLASPALAPAPTTDDPNAVAGTLRRIARTEPEIVVVSAGKSGAAEKETTIAVPESARILRDQKPIRYTDLHEGEGVLVRTEKKDGQLLAKSIEAGTPAAGAAATPAGGDRKIERLRSLLKMIDGFLQMADGERGPPGP